MFLSMFCFGSSKIHRMKIEISKTFLTVILYSTDSFSILMFAFTIRCQLMRLYIGTEDKIVNNFSVHRHLVYPGPFECLFNIKCILSNTNQVSSQRFHRTLHHISVLLLFTFDYHVSTPRCKTVTQKKCHDIVTILIMVMPSHQLLNCSSTN